MGIKGYAAKGPKQPLEPFEYEPGPLGPHEVEVKVSHCGICHSDLAMIDNDWGFSAYPLVPGHEVVGTIASVGSDVEGVEVGQSGRRRLALRVVRPLRVVQPGVRVALRQRAGDDRASSRRLGRGGPVRRQVRRADPRRDRFERGRPVHVRREHGVHADGTVRGEADDADGRRRDRRPGSPRRAVPGGLRLRGDGDLLEPLQGRRGQARWGRPASSPPRGPTS